MKMTKRDKQVNVRMTKDEYENLTEVATTEDMTRSDVLRLSFLGEMTQRAELKSTSMSDEERKRVVELFGYMNTELSKISREVSYMRHDNARRGNNINQIAKRLNTGEELNAVQEELLNELKSARSDYADLNKRIEHHDKLIESMLDGLQAQWRILA